MFAKSNYILSKRPHHNTRGWRQKGTLAVCPSGGAPAGSSSKWEDSGEGEAWASRGLAVPDAVGSLRSSPASSRVPFSLLRLSSLGSTTPAQRVRGREGPGRRSQWWPRLLAPAWFPGWSSDPGAPRWESPQGSDKGPAAAAGGARRGQGGRAEASLSCARRPRGPSSPQLGVRGCLVPAPRPGPSSLQPPLVCARLLSRRSASSETVPQRHLGFPLL